MKNKFIKISVAFLLLLSLAYPTFVFLFFSTIRIEHLISDACQSHYGHIRKLVIYYIKRTDKIFRPSNYPVTLLTYTLNGYGVTPNDPEKILQVAEILLQRGLNINEIGPSGGTALHSAVILNQPELVKFLLKHKADRTIGQKILKGHPMNGKNPLQVAQWLQKNSKTGVDYSEVISLLQQR
ncbi:ankyrin repeat domain-containing protein [Candidatus Riflebacteria bacterium]